MELILQGQYNAFHSGLQKFGILQIGTRVIEAA
jgi:hypothetical protein